MQNEIDDLAKDCINQVRTRARLDMSEAGVTLPRYSGYSQDQWIKLIRRERRIEALQLSMPLSFIIFKNQSHNRF